MSRLLLIVLFAAFTSVVEAAGPLPPQHLTSAVDEHIVTLTWQASSGGTTPLGYLVEASLSPEGDIIAAFLVLDTSLVRTAVPDGVYYVRVRSGNAEGISAASQVIVVVGGGGTPCPSPPGPATNVGAQVSGTLVTLNWDAPSAGCAPSGYVLQAGSVAGLSDLATHAVGGTTSLTVSAPPGAYFVRVIACNDFGNSVASNELTVLVSDLTGVWSGTSDYINAPFQFDLVQNGRLVRGSYQDQKDKGSGVGVLTGNRIRLDVNFGDTGIRYEGTIETENRIRGTLLVPVLGRTFTFEMIR